MKTIQDIRQEYKKRFGDFPTSALWFVPVEDFISQQFKEVLESLRRKTDNRTSCESPEYCDGKEFEVMSINDDISLILGERKGGEV